MWITLVNVFWLICILVVISLVVSIFQIRRSVKENGELLHEILERLENNQDK